MAINWIMPGKKAAKPCLKLSPSSLEKDFSGFRLRWKEFFKCPFRFHQPGGKMPNCSMSFALWTLPKYCQAWRCLLLSMTSAKILLQHRVEALPPPSLEMQRQKWCHSPPEHLLVHYGLVLYDIILFLYI